MSQSKAVTKAVVTSTFATGIFLAAPHLADAALGDQTLKKGMTHPDVKELQEALRVGGHFTYKESTVNFGTMTEEAVRSFQQKHGLVVDGIAGPRTIERLKGQAAVSEVPKVTQPTVTQPTQTVTPTTVLKMGISSEAVSTLQQKLKEQGYFNHEITGYYGRVTANAVRSFQQKNGLLVDGIAGAQTLSMLMNGTTLKKPTVATTQSTPTNQQQVVTGMKVGERGEQVTKLQEQLKQLGYFKAEPTGYYGTVTEEAVRAFQTKQQILVSGVADQFTVNLIEQLVVEASKTPQIDFNVMNVVADASELLGTPYLWGGGTPDGFDCSGFLQYVYAKNGKKLPRTVAAMWESGTEVAEPRVGDLVFFETYAEGASHAGIYIGNNQFIHSGTSTGVVIASLDVLYWSDRYLGAKRF
ncbi:MAG TPA: peptidase [Bacilli bacterium]|nr:peptidase [Bacilli bacterium]